MTDSIENILLKQNFSDEDLLFLLQSEKEDKNKLFQKSLETKRQFVGNKVYLRGLIEYSNRCSKNCLYCGIRNGNKKVKRYLLTEQQVIDAARFAFESNYGSIVLQSGEISSKIFIDTIERILKEIKNLSAGKLGVTLSLGEQKEETYHRWFAAGAHRYLLRIETSNPELYTKIHPDNKKHDYQTRLNALHLLKKVGFQVGTGVMIGLPFQQLSDLVSDIRFFQNFDIDMIGMGPYLEHEDTPLFKHRNELLTLTERFNLTLKMIAIVRIVMKDINIAATTAMQAIDPIGREKAIKIGANIIMPNITPAVFRQDYKLYENKPCIDENADDCSNCMEARIKLAGDEIGYGEWGDSKHFGKRMNFQIEN